MARFELPAGLEDDDPRHARALRRLARRGRLRSERRSADGTELRRSREPGGARRARVKLFKVTDDAELVTDDQGNARLVWPDVADRHRLVAAREAAFARFLADQHGGGGESLGELRERFLADNPQWAPAADRHSLLDELAHNAFGEPAQELMARLVERHPEYGADR